MTKPRQAAPLYRQHDGAGEEPTSLLRIARKGWRPALAWAFVIGWSLTLLTVIGMLWARMATLDEAAGVIMTLLGTGGLPATVFAGGRSLEKYAGVADHDPLGAGDIGEPVPEGAAG